MTFRIGLTGSMGMGKSTTAAMFAAEGVPVWDADQTVHDLYSAKGAANAHVLRLCPDAGAPDGSVSRPVLRKMIAADPGLLDRITAIVHPLVAMNRDGFVSANADSPVILFDIPLLFENGLDVLCDGIAVVTAPPDLQRKRIGARSSMTAAEIDLILARQMSDAEKRRRATWIIQADTLESARAQVRMILIEIRERISHA